MIKDIDFIKKIFYNRKLIFTNMFFSLFSSLSFFILIFALFIGNIWEFDSSTITYLAWTTPICGSFSLTIAIVWIINSILFIRLKEIRSSLLIFFIFSFLIFIIPFIQYLSLIIEAKVWKNSYWKQLKNEIKINKLNHKKSKHNYKIQMYDLSLNKIEKDPNINN